MPTWHGASPWAWPPPTTPIDPRRGLLHTPCSVGEPFQARPSGADVARHLSVGLAPSHHPDRPQKGSPTHGGSCRRAFPGSTVRCQFGACQVPDPTEPSAARRGGRAPGRVGAPDTHMKQATGLAKEGRYRSGQPSLALQAKTIHGFGGRSDSLTVRWHSCRIRSLCSCGGDRAVSSLRLEGG